MSDLHRAEMAESKLDWIKRWVEAQPRSLRYAFKPILETIDAEVWDGYQTIDLTALEPRDYPADGHVKVQGGLEIPIHRVRLDHKEP